MPNEPKRCQRFRNAGSRVVKISTVSYALCIGAVAALIAGCGGSQPPIAPGAMPQSYVMATQAERSGSWMLPEAKRRSLLYLADYQRVYVYSYPRGAQVGMLAGFADAYSACSDKGGDIFVNDASQEATYEFAHGGTSPIATLYSPYSFPAGCAVDPTTGNLAVVAQDGLSIFTYNAKRGWRYPRGYNDGIYSGYSCSYDNKGNLFVDGESSPAGKTFEFAELAKGASAFAPVSLNQKIGSAGSVQWDGKYVAIGDPKAAPQVIYRFSVADYVGTKHGSIPLGNLTLMFRFWIQSNKAVVSGAISNSQAGVNFYGYPSGGSPLKTIDTTSAAGVTVSVAPQ
jgi:hypothetical protein